MVSLIFGIFLVRDAAQLAQCRTGTPLRQVRFPSAARDFSPRVSFQCGPSYGIPTPHCAIACITISGHVKDRVIDPCQSSVDYGDTETPSMHRRLGSAILLQLVFPGESDPNFPWKKSHWGNTVKSIVFKVRIIVHTHS